MSFMPYTVHNMRAIIIAAGRGGRMGSLAEDLPKTLIPIEGKPLLHHTLATFSRHGIDSIAIVRGYKAERFPDIPVRYYLNADYAKNNVLHSLMYARGEFVDDLVISYSDIWYSDAVFQNLLETEGDIVVSVDTDWHKRYEGRTLHPISEAENVLFNEEGTLLKIGKHLEGKAEEGEFLGLLKLSKEGAQTFLREFLKLENSLDPLGPFEKSKEWRKAYLTDLLQYLVNKGYPVHCSLHKGPWLEMDTPQDYETAAAIIRKERSA